MLDIEHNTAVGGDRFRCRVVTHRAGERYDKVSPVSLKNGTTSTMEP